PWVVEISRVLFRRRFLHRNFVPVVASVVPDDGFSEQLVAVAADSVQIDIRTSDWPESSGAGFVLIPVGTVRRTDEDTLPWKRYAPPSIWFAVMIHRTGQYLFDLCRIRFAERIHFRQLNKHDAFDVHIEILRCDSFVLFGVMSSSDNPQR